MKNLNFNFKSIVRSKARWLLTLIAIFTLGVGQMWGGSFTSDGSTAFYFHKTQYIKDKDETMDYSAASAVIWVYMWNDSGDAWYKATHISGDIWGVKVTDAATFTKFVIARKNPSGGDANNGNWKDVWTQTNDYDFSDGNNYKTTSGWEQLNSYAVGKTLYLKVNSNWTSGNQRFAACFGGVTGQTWVNCSQVGSSDYYSVTVPEGEWPMVIFVRLDAAKEGNNWGNKWDQTDDLFYEYDKNLCTITGWSNSQTRGQYAPTGALHGSMNNWVMMSFNPFNGDGELTLELGANTAYEFQIISGEDWYGYGNTNYKHTLVGQTEETTLSTGGKDILILTADAGEYTFNWDKSSHELSVTYPNLPNSTNPNPNYVYVKNTSNWSPVNAHLWGGTNGTVYGYNPALSSVTFNSTTYYYAAAGYESSIIFGQGVSDSYKTGDLTISDGKGKYYEPSTTSWKYFSSRITLNNQSATTAGTESVDADLFSTTLSSITCPGKTGYTFGGYFTATGGGGSQIIEDDGDWIASVSGYTNSSTQWIRANTELFAKWTAKTTTVTLNANGGNANGEVVATYDAALPAFSPLTRSGNYVLTGYWTSSTGGTKIINANGTFVDNSGVWNRTDGATLLLYAQWATVTTPSVSAATTNWGGSPIAISLSATSSGLAEPLVIFEVNDGTNTYTVMGAPYGSDGASLGSIGAAGGNYSTVHKATFSATSAGTYTVTAKLYTGKLIDNFDNSFTHWKELGDGTFDASEANPARQTANGSSKVMKITRGDAEWKTVQTKQAANNETTTDWNLDYGYIYMSMYSTSARSTKMKYSDNYSTAAEVTSSDISASTWTRVKFTVGSGHQVDYILPFMLAEGTMYIDDIFLSNEATPTMVISSASANTTIRNQYTITLNNHDADITTGTTSVTATYGETTNLTSNITIPVKSGYAFMGYYTGESGTGSQLIAQNGAWIKSIASYTGASGDNATWIYANDITLHAYYVVRYGLYGSLDADGNPAEGMPGWSVSEDFTYNSGVSPNYTLDVDLTKPNTNYKFRIIDRRNNYSWGLSSKAVIGEKTTTTLNSGTADALLSTAGVGTYSLTVTEADEGVHPAVYIVNPTSYLVTYGVVGTGGSISSVVDGEDTPNAISNGQYIKDDGTLVFTHSAATTGYEFGGWYKDAECTEEYEDGSDNATIEGSVLTLSSIGAAVTVYAKFVPATLTFTGSTDWDWFDASNWSPACVPTIDHDVILQANTRLYGVEVKGKGNHAKAKSIKIDKSTDARKNIRFEIWSYCSLIVAEDIQAKHVGDADYGAVNAEDLRIETSHFQNGGLICGGASSNTSATYEFHSKSYKSGKWYINQYVGIPFTSMKANQLYDFNIFIYADTVDDWRSPASDTMEPWVGYDLIRQHSGDVSDHDLNGTLILPGKGVGKTKTLSCTRRNPSDPKWDEETNPFPASIDGKSGHQDHMFANSWTAPIEIAAMETSDFTHLVHTIYIFNAGYEDGSSREIGDEAGQWSTFPLESVKAGLIANAVIPAMQAFLVTDTASGSSITLDYKKHVYDPAVAADSIRTFPTRAPRRVKKSSSLNSLTMLVRSEEDVIADRLYIIEGNNLRTDTFDNGWDGNKIMGESFAPQLYAMSDGSKMAVNAVKDMEGMKIGFKAGTSAQDYTLSFDYEEQAEPLYLYDKETNAYTEITNEATYEFTTYDKAEHNRFLLTRSNAPQIATGVEEIDTENVQRAQKFMQDQQIFIRRGDKVYSIDGALVK